MNYETIQMLKFEKLNIDLSKSYVSHSKKATIYNLFINKPDSVLCPSCKSNKITIHGYTVKKISHSILTEEKAIINYHSRRYKCKLCNKTFEDTNPFSQSGHSTSYVTIKNVLDDLRSHTATYTSVAKKYFLSIQNVIDIFDQYVNCERKILPPVLCIDEIYTRKLTDNAYSCVMLDFITMELVDIVDSRRKLDLSKYFSHISIKERDSVKYIVIDMYEPYKQVANIYFPKAIIAIDSFHVMKNLNFAMDRIRIKIMNKYNPNHNNLKNADIYYYFLKKFSFFFKMNFDNISRKKFNIGKNGLRWDKYEIRKYLLTIDDDLRIAYQLWQDYYEFNFCANIKTAENDLNELTARFKDSFFNEFIDFGRLLEHWHNEIKNSFITIKKRRLSNGCMEGVNSRLKTMIHNANGFDNFSHFRNRAMFAINKNMPIKL